MGGGGCGIDAHFVQERITYEKKRVTTARGRKTKEQQNLDQQLDLGFKKSGNCGHLGEQLADHFWENEVKD